MITLQPTLQQQIDQLAQNMICIEGDSLDMGSEDGRDNEKPVHKVTVPDFYLCKYPVTQELWEAVMGKKELII